MHFRWKTRPDGKIEVDLIIFEGDAVWKRVGKVTDGRVYLLDFTTGEQKLFFWMQEPVDDNDEDIAEKINSYLQPQGN